MITDIALVLIPIPMMWKIQIAVGKKGLVLGLFATRIVFVRILLSYPFLTACRVPAITIVQLVYLSDQYLHLDDQTWWNATPWIVTQVVMNTSIITACIPSLRRVVTELRTHQTGVTVSEGMEFGTVKSEKAYGTANSKSTARTQYSKRQSTPTNADEEGQIMPYGHNPPHDKRTKGLAHITSGKRSPAWQTETPVRQSQERLRDENKITRTVDYTVEEDDHVAKSSDGDRSIEYKAM